MSSSRMTTQSRSPRLPNTQRRPVNRQVRWQGSQPPVRQNPFMMDDFDDIPVALREGNSHVKRSASKWRWVVVGGSLAGAVGLSMGIAAAFLNANPGALSFGKPAPAAGSAIAAMGNGPLNADSTTSGSFTTAVPGSAPQPAQSTPTADGGVPLARQAPGQVEAATAGSPEATETDVILGHYAFKEANPAELVDLGGGLQLNRATAEAFKEMRAAAQADGVNLLPLSGFRTVETQKDLFFGVKAERGQTASERAKVSAPPGHSEHHTGYALDIGEAGNGATDLSEQFEKTAAFAWLQKNAPYYSFELSFPRDNQQGVSYEPWHWRYVGDQASLELFHRAR